MSLTGDFAGLAKLIDKFEKAGDPSLFDALSRALTAEAISLTQAGFAGQHSPYDEAWAPLKRRAGMILQDTGRLRGSVTASSSRTEVRIRATAAYGAFHQYGTSRMPKREFLPREGELPPAWRAPFEDATTELIEALFK